MTYTLLVYGLKWDVRITYVIVLPPTPTTPTTTTTQVKKGFY